MWLRSLEDGLIPAPRQRLPEILHARSELGSAVPESVHNDLQGVIQPRVSVCLSADYSLAQRG